MPECGRRSAVGVLRPRSAACERQRLGRVVVGGNRGEREMPGAPLEVALADGPC